MEEAEIGIVGAGMAGTLLALALLEEGYGGENLVLIDGGDESAGSMAPATMLHAFVGRSMKLKRGQGEYFLRSFDFLRALARRSQGKGSSTWWTERPMFRLIDEGPRGERLAQSYEEEKNTFPKEMSVIRREYRGREGLEYTPAAGVSTQVMLEVLQAELRSRGVEVLRGRKVREIQEGEQSVVLHFEAARSLAVKKVVLAMGAWLKAWFPQLDLRTRGGELLLLRPPAGADLSMMINGEKHVFARADGLWGLGSTYFSEEEWDARDPEEASEELISGLESFLPELREARAVELWRGRRGVFGSDHLPLVGVLPERKRVFLFGSFGSKGLLHSPAMAQDLAKALRTGDPKWVAAEVRPSRVKANRFVAPLCRLG